MVFGFQVLGEFSWVLLCFTTLCLWFCFLFLCDSLAQSPRLTLNSQWSSSSTSGLLGVVFSDDSACFSARLRGLCTNLTVVRYNTLSGEHRTTQAVECGQTSSWGMSRGLWPSLKLHPVTYFLLGCWEAKPGPCAHSTHHPELNPDSIQFKCENNIPRPVPRPLVLRVCSQTW